MISIILIIYLMIVSPLQEIEDIEDINTQLRKIIKKQKIEVLVLRRDLKRDMFELEMYSIYVNGHKVFNESSTYEVTGDENDRE